LNRLIPDLRTIHRRVDAVRYRLHARCGACPVNRHSIKAFREE